jgi:hypothetical protein
LGFELCRKFLGDGAMRFRITDEDVGHRALPHEVRQTV